MTPHPRSRRRVWPWVLVTAVLLMLATVAAGIWAVVALADATQNSIHVVLNGQAWDGWRDWDLVRDWTDWREVLLNTDVWSLSLTGLLLAAVLVVLAFVIVPLAVVLALTGVAVGLGVALLVVLLVVAVASSPLWLVALLLWLLLRDKPTQRTASMTA